MSMGCVSGLWPVPWTGMEASLARLDWLFAERTPANE